MRIQLIFSLLVLAISAFSQIGRASIQISGRFPTYSKKFSSILSVSANAATAAQMQSISASVYKEQKYALPEIGILYGLIVKRIPSGSIGLAFQHSGNITYRETILSVIYGKAIGKADLAAKFNYLYTVVEGFRPAREMTITIAGRFHLSEQFHSGFQIQHLNAVFSGDPEMPGLQSEYRFGVGYDVSPLVHLGVEYEVLQPVAATINAIIAYKVHERCLLTMGLGTFVPVTWFGVQFSIRTLKIGMKAAYDWHLGFTPAIWVLFNKRKPE